MIPQAGSIQVQGHLAVQSGWERQQSGISGLCRKEKGGEGWREGKAIGNKRKR